MSIEEHVEIDHELEWKTLDLIDANRDFEESFSFYVMGDTPYNEQEAKLLTEQISGLDEDALFMVHVGDLMKSSTCAIDRYQDSSRILQGSPIPVLVLPGDNDWIDCPSPNLALRRFRRYFISRQNDNLYFTELFRQKQRRENFFFEFDGVLFFGLNLLGEENNNWSRRYKDNLQWFHLKSKGILRSTRAVVLFAHSVKARPVYNKIKRRLARLKIPTLVLHGNGHQFYQRQFGTDLLRIQVDRGGVAPPLKVTIRKTTKKNVVNFNATNKITFANIFEVDRQKLV